MRNRIAFFTKLIKMIRFVAGWEKFQNLFPVFPKINEWIYFSQFSSKQRIQIWKRSTENKEDELYLEEVYGL